MVSIGANTVNDLETVETLCVLFCVQSLFLLAFTKHAETDQLPRSSGMTPTATFVVSSDMSVHAEIFRNVSFNRFLNVQPAKPKKLVSAWFLILSVTTVRLSFGANAGISNDCIYKSGGLTTSNVLDVVSCSSVDEQLLSKLRSALHVTVHLPVRSVVRLAFESTKDSGGSVKHADLFTTLRPPLVNVHVTRPNLSEVDGFLSV
jgi:hypothetical protein